MKKPYTAQCPNAEKIEVNDHVDCKECNWEQSCEDCGGFNDGVETRCIPCQLSREINAAEFASDVARGK